MKRHINEACMSFEKNYLCAISESLETSTFLDMIDFSDEQAETKQGVAHKSCSAQIKFRYRYSFGYHHTLQTFRTSYCRSLCIPIHYNDSVLPPKWSNPENQTVWLLNQSQFSLSKDRCSASPVPPLTRYCLSFNTLCLNEAHLPA